MFTEARKSAMSMMAEKRKKEMKIMQIMQIMHQNAVRVTGLKTTCRR